MASSGIFSAGRGLCLRGCLPLHLTSPSLLPQDGSQHLHVAIHIYQRLTGFLHHFTLPTTSLLLKPSPFLSSGTSHLPLLPSPPQPLLCLRLGPSRGPVVLKVMSLGLSSFHTPPGWSHSLHGFSSDLKAKDAWICLSSANPLRHHRLRSPAASLQPLWLPRGSAHSVNSSLSSSLPLKKDCLFHTSMNHVLQPLVPH